jgi:hypothetical protein
MPVDVPAPTQVLTFVFVAWAVGTVTFGAWSRLWGEIQQGHFKVIWLVCTVLSGAAGFGYRPAWLLTAASAGTFAAIYAGRDREAGLITSMLGLLVLGLGTPAYGFAAAALTGAVTNAMLLGHWHLNQPRLGTKPIARLVWSAAASIALFAVASGVLLARSSSIQFFAAGTAVAFAVFAGILTGMVQHLVRTRSIISATGILYLEILLCFVAVFTGSVAALPPR